MHVGWSSRIHALEIPMMRAGVARARRNGKHCGRLVKVFRRDEKRSDSAKRA
jgi:hypothetical protein